MKLLKVWDALIIRYSFWFFTWSEFWCHVFYWSIFIVGRQFSWPQLHIFYEIIVILFTLRWSYKRVNVIFGVNSCRHFNVLVCTKATSCVSQIVNTSFILISIFATNHTAISGDLSCTVSNLCIKRFWKSIFVILYPQIDAVKAEDVEMEVLRNLWLLSTDELEKDQLMSQLSGLALVSYNMKQYLIQSSMVMESMKSLLLFCKSK